MSSVQHLIQYVDVQGIRRVGLVQDADTVLPLRGQQTTYHLAQRAIAEERSLAELLLLLTGDTLVEYEALLAEGRVLPPLDHPDPAHLLLTSTVLTHLGSADARDRMHKQAQAADTEAAQTDSLRMFQLGVEGGKPAPGEVGVQPEWFYKGDGSHVVAPGQPLTSPAFALGGGEEPEIVGLYVIGPRGVPYRLGFALGNEFSDHVMEKENYLYLAHSKLRPCAYGPELRLGDLPDDVRGTVRIWRGPDALWEQEFLSGEVNMSHSLANLEHHHFKYPLFRRPGDAHAHFFGTATLSFAAGMRLQPQDVIEIAAQGFWRPLRNPVAVAPAEEVTVQSL